MPATTLLIPRSLVSTPGSMLYGSLAMTNASGNWVLYLGDDSTNPVLIACEVSNDSTFASPSSTQTPTTQAVQTFVQFNALAYSIMF